MAAPSKRPRPVDPSSSSWVPPQSSSWPTAAPCPPLGQPPLPSSSWLAAAPIPPHVSPQTLPHPSIQPAAPLSSNQSRAACAPPVRQKVSPVATAAQGEEKMYVVKRDGRQETMHFDKITAWLKKLSYGLSQEHCDPMLVAQKVYAGVYKGITSNELAAETAVAMTASHPDHASFAARIAVSNLHKNTKKSFSETIKDMYGHYDERSGLMAPVIADDVYEVTMKLSSRFLICMKDDNIEGIYDTLKECVVISKSVGRIGVLVHNIRATGSYIQGTNGTSNGIVPMF